MMSLLHSAVSPCVVPKLPSTYAPPSSFSFRSGLGAYACERASASASVNAGNNLVTNQPSASGTPTSATQSPPPPACVIRKCAVPPTPAGSLFSLSLNYSSHTQLQRRYSNRQRSRNIRIRNRTLAATERPTCLRTRERWVMRSN